MSGTLLVVTGLPAAGKTFLGSQLAQALGWAFVSKDEYKEILHQALPDLTRAQAGPLSFELMYHVAGVVLAAQGPVIMETHFYRGASEPKILDLVSRFGARLLQVFCEAPLGELRRRHAERVEKGDHPHIHFPWFDVTTLPEQACWTPLSLEAPVLRVDTTQGNGTDGVLRWIRETCLDEGDEPVGERGPHVIGENTGGPTSY